MQRDLPELPKIDAPPNPKVAYSLWSCHNAGGRFRRTGRSCFDVLRTPKYNKPLGKVKNYLLPPGTFPGTCCNAYSRAYFSAFSRAEKVIAYYDKELQKYGK